MKRRLTCLLLVLAMILTLLPIQAFAADSSKPVDTANPFEDVQQGSWYYDAVQYVRVNSLFYGTGKTTFRPEGAMTRGMFVTVLGRMAGVDPDNYTGPSQFTDVPETAFFAPYVAWAAKYGITVGTGNGKFSPNSSINRQQMAVFFVRYFEAFDVDYQTGANITTTPADLDSVSPWAQDAVLKLWRQGLLVGSGGKFRPLSSATRAQAASICFRTDEAVDTWYSEPGVPSTRVRINPATGLPYDSRPSGGGSGSGGSGGGSSGGGTTTTTYYMVTFALGTDQTGMTLPASGTYPANTQIGALPTPTAAGADRVFLGWYYDEAMSRPAKQTDTLTGDVTLYAKVGASASVRETDTPNYIAAQDLPADFPLKLGGTNINAGDLTIINVTANNANVTFTVNGGAVTITGIEGVDREETTRPEFSGRWNPGDTYKAVLKDDSSAVFIDRSGAEQALTIRTYNFTIARSETKNLELNSGLKYIPKSETTGMSDSLEGLFQVSLEQGTDGQTKPVTKVAQTGSFTYSGSENIAVGDTVAIYETKGNRALDSEMTLTDSDYVAYVEITSVNRTTYGYKTAEAEDVLFTPDVLPVNSGKKADGNTLTLTEGDMSELRTNLADMGLDANVTVDKGDFIAFYEGNLSGQTRAAGNQPEYGKVTNVSKNGDTYTVTYSPATESDVLSAMDIYTKEEKEIKLTEEQKKAIENGIAQQAVKSGFLDEAARELTALALETDGFQKLAEDFDLESYAVTFADGTPAGPENLALMDGAKAKITKKEIKPKVHIGDLDHFDESKGIRIELVMNLTIEVGESDKKLVIELQAAFEQEVMLSVNASGGAIWKWAVIIPYIYDYRLNANIDVGTYTGIGITATAKTESEGDGGFDWNMTTGDSAGDKIIDIGKQIKDLMEEKDKFMGKDLVGGDDGGDDDDGGIPISGGLAEKYAAMIEDAGEDTSWIEIFRYEIFAEEGSVDPFHILCYGISADFVVKANFYVTLGMTFEYGAAKRYNFSIMLFHKESTNETIDLETPHYRFTFYVMGTMGIKAGVEFEIGVGLFSLKLDSIGICAEAGAYAQMWGYFYYEATWEQGKGKDSQYSGAMLIEIGVYLEISFKAQLFSSDKLTYQPTIYEHQWPILTVGEQENVLDFAEYDDDGNDIGTEYNMMAVTTLTLPSALFSMQYLDMQSGETGGNKDDDGEMQPGRNCDDDTESHFEITMSDSRYTYDPKTNTVTVSPEAGAVELPACTMTIRWKNGVLAFTSQPIERVVTITWSNPANVRYIAFNSMGGSAVNQIAGAAGTAITQPAPTKVGYGFGGWYTDRACTNEYPFPDTLPENFNGEQGITLYAKWEPNPKTPYTVEHYQEELNGTYTRTATEKLTGETDGIAAVTAKSYDHFTVKEVPAVRIAPNGSTVVRVYYDRNKYQVAFTYGSPDGMSTVPEARTYTAKYGAKVYAPLLSLEGYRFTDFSPSVPTGGAIEVTGNATYAAQWTVRDDTPYRVEHYLQRVSGDGYLLDSVESKTGTTGAAASAVPKTISGFTCNRTEPSSATIAPDGSTVLKLYYNRESYILTLNPDGGTLQGGTTETLRFGAPIAAETPVKTGYTFAGWFYTKDGTEVQLQAGDTMPAGNLTLTAKWTARGDIPYKVEHYWQDADTGDYTLHETENLTGATGAAVTATARTYEHYSQNTSASGTVSSGTILVDGSLTLRLYYDLDTVTVTFEPNGGTMTAAATSTFRYGQTFSGPTPTRTGYGFSGWFSAGTKYDSSTKVTGDVTLTAQWAEGQVGYMVEHYLMDLSGSYPAAATYTDSETGTTGVAINIADKQKTYEGFAYDHAGESSYTVAGDGTTVVKLYYSRSRYTLTWELNGGTAGGSYTPAGQVYYGAAITKPTVTRTGYTPTWGEVPAAMPAGDVTGTVTWTANAREVTFEPNGGDGTAVTKTFTYGQTNVPPTFTRTGYTLKGWSGSPTSTDMVDPYALPAAGTTPVTLHAVWEPVSYTITYELGGGTNHTGNPKSYTVTDAVTLAAPTRTGYNFLGWYTDPTYAEGSKVTGISAGSTGNRTFYARWEKKTAGVEYLPWPDLYEGITGIEDLLAEGYTLSDNLKAGDSLPTDVQMKDGYYFQCWVADPTALQQVTKVPEGTTGTYTVYMAYTKGEISNADDLVYIAQVAKIKTESSGYYYGIMIGGDYKLTGDVTLPANWDGIDRFEGSLDGQGHTITYPDGMTAKPLFRVVNAGAGNVAVQNVNISIGAGGGGRVDVPADAKNWGLIVNELASGTIRSCAVSGGTIYNSNAVSDISLVSLGGIAGRVSNTSGAIENCSVGTATAPLCIENYEDNGSHGGIVGVLGGTCSFADGAAPSYVVLGIRAAGGHYALYGGIAGSTGASAKLEFDCGYDLYVSSNKESTAYEKLGAITGMYAPGGSITISSGAVLRVHSALRDMERGKQSDETGSSYVSIEELDGGDKYVTFTNNGTYSKDAVNVPAVPSAASAASLGLRAAFLPAAGAAHRLRP